MPETPPSTPKGESAPTPPPSNMINVIVTNASIKTHSHVLKVLNATVRVTGKV